MSHFYGTLQGSRGQATRCGTRSSGVVTEAAGWKGCVETYVFEKDGLDMFEVRLKPWQYSGGEYQVIAKGRLDARCVVKTFSKIMKEDIPPPCAAANSNR